MLDLIQYILLGIIQGLTEPLPVSSSGHLRIFSHFFGIGVPDLHLETFLNAASLIAVFIVFKKDLTELITGTISYVAKRRETDKEMFRFSVLIIIGTIPAVIIGGLFYDTFGAEFTQLHYVAAALLITGIALYIIRKLRGTKDEGRSPLRMRS